MSLNQFIITPFVAAAKLVKIVINVVARSVWGMIGSYFEWDTPTPTLKDRKSISNYSEYCFFKYNHSGRRLSCQVMNPYKTITISVALDCKMVGLGERGNIQALARVSVVNSYGYCLFDTFVQPYDIVTAYRTQWSGIMAGDLDGAPPARYATNKVTKIINGRILIGHNINKDLAILGITHPERDIRDTAEIFGESLGKQEQCPSLKFLAEKYFGICTHDGRPNSIEDAQITMALYQLKTSERNLIEKRLSRVNNLDADVTSIDRLAQILESGLGNLRTEMKTLKQEILADRNEVMARLELIGGSRNRVFVVNRPE